MKVLLLCFLACNVALGAQDGEAVLHWKDGGRLRGSIAPGQADSSYEVRLHAPQFAGELVLARGALDEIEFVGGDPSEAPEGGAFRVVTTTGDVWTADLTGSDPSALTFHSERLGEVRVPRSAVRTIERVDDPAVLLDASRFAREIEELSGPLEDLRFWVYDDFADIIRSTGDALGVPENAPGRDRVIPLITDNQVDDIRLDFGAATPRFEGSRSRGFVDLGLNPSGSFDGMAMVFEGRFQAEQRGRHTFVVRATHGARLFVDGELVVEGKTLAGMEGGSATRDGSVELTAGAHDLRVVYFNFVKEEELIITMIGPGGEERPLSGKNLERTWVRGPGGHARTEAKDARLWHAVEFPVRFEVALELISSASPRFLVSFEGDGEVPALALETWGDLLVMTQGDVFEPLGTLLADQGAVDLRLAFDGEQGTLEVFDGGGRSLGTASGVRLPTGATGISLRNRGADLTARRFVVRRGLRVAQAIDTMGSIEPERARVQLRDGRVVYGRLEVGASGAFVLSEQGAREAVELADVELVLNPAATPRSATGLSTLTYADGAVLHGEVGALHPEHVELVPAFMDEPLACSTVGASRLTLEDAAPTPVEQGPLDELETSAGVLRGFSSFGGEAGPLAFQPLGAARATELVTTAEARLRRSSLQVEPEPAFDAVRFPHVLHSRAGERVPCELVAWRDDVVTVRIPFCEGAREVDAAQVKALDLTGDTLSAHVYRTSEASGKIPAQLLERALMVPRFRRKDPDDFVLLARSDDLLRGELVSILGGVLRVESKLKEQDVSLERLALIVNVEERAVDETAGALVTLVDGTTLGLAPDAVSDGLLRGRSAAYGDVAVPIDRITDVRLGPAASAAGEGTFAAWVARPAPEPTWGD